MMACIRQAILNSPERAPPVHRCQQCAEYDYNTVTDWCTSSSGRAEIYRGGGYKGTHAAGTTNSNKQTFGSVFVDDCTFPRGLCVFLVCPWDYTKARETEPIIEDKKGEGIQTPPSRFRVVGP